MENKNDKCCLRLLEIKKSIYGLSKKERRLYNRLDQKHINTIPERKSIEKELFANKYIKLEVLERGTRGDIKRFRYSILDKGVEAISIYASKSETFSQIRIRRGKSIVTIITITIAALSLTLNVILGWLSYSDKRNIDRKQDRIEMLEKEIKILKKNTGANKPS